MPTKPEKRIAWIDALRVYAIVCIIITHVVRSKLPIATHVILLMIIGSAALFFMASGALVLPLDKPAGPWLRRRFIAVGVPMVIWGIFYAFIYDAVLPDYHYNAPVWQRLLSIPFGQRGSMWFLNVLLGMYLLVPLISPWIRQATRRQVEVLLIAWLLAGFYPYINLFFGIGYHTDATMTIFGGLHGFFGFFIAGYYFVRWPLRERSKGNAAAIVVILLAFSAVGAVMFGPAIRNDVAFSVLNDLAVNNMAWFTLVFVLFTMIPPVSERLGRIISFFGRGVFGAYLSMDFVITCLVQPNIPDPLWGAVTAVVLCFVIGLTLRHIPVIGKYIC